MQGVAGRIAGDLGEQPFVSPTVARLLIEASVQPDPASGGWRVRIAVWNDAGVREGVRELVVAGHDCNQAADTAALAIALMIDPSARQRTASTSTPSSVAFPSTEVAPPIPASPTPPPVPDRPAPTAPLQAKAPPPARRDKPEPWRLRFGLYALGVVGRLPHPTWGIGASERISSDTRRAGIDLSFSYLASRRAEFRPNEGGDFSALIGGTSFFWAPLRTRRASLSVAPGAQIGRLIGHGFGFSSATHSTETWLVSASVSLELSWALAPHWSVLLGPSVGISLVRDSFDATTSMGTNLVFRPPPVTATLSLGFALEP